MDYRIERLTFFTKVQVLVLCGAIFTLGSEGILPKGKKEILDLCKIGLGLKLKRR